jgi:hypothetical protein
MNIGRIAPKEGFFQDEKPPIGAPCPASGFGRANLGVSTQLQDRRRARAHLCRRLSLAATEASSGGWAVAFGDLRDGCAAAARDVLDCTPRLTGGQHAGDTFVAAGVFWTPLVSAFGLGLRLALCLGVGGRHSKGAQPMKFVEPSHFTDPDAAARKLLEIANATEPAQEGRFRSDHLPLNFWPQFAQQVGRQAVGHAWTQVEVEVAAVAGG